MLDGMFTGMRHAPSDAKTYFCAGSVSTDTNSAGIDGDLAKDVLAPAQRAQYTHKTHKGPPPDAEICLNWPIEASNTINLNGKDRHQNQ